MKNSTKELMQQAGEIQDSLSGDILGLATYFRSAKESLNKDGMLSSKGVMEKSGPKTKNGSRSNADDC